ncbi:hypothetical protein [Neorhizobium galegae]|uniref:hypothetical protein n=1 Tax=Neorhizobium galegae TaxID=399 RepID=UPI0006210CC1|nr:hypothetical protein [Neorhizobium galegae]CDZ54435.1 Hypothetical protein NGAL_HAMBI2427_56400 [Neorhizobium galegae bv. orientalis]
MRIGQRSAFAKRLASDLYSGDSRPIAVMKESDRPHSEKWWSSEPQSESPESLRHLAALVLFLEIAKHSKFALPENTFPASFDFDDEQMRPDKAVIKVFLDHGLISSRLMVAQLVFDVTPSGTAYLERRKGEL